MTLPARSREGQQDIEGILSEVDLDLDNCLIVCIKAKDYSK